MSKINPTRERMKPGKRKVKKKVLNYWVDLGILVLFTALAISGLVLQTVYHIGDHGPDVAAMGMDQAGWLLIHKVFSILSCLGIGVHIQLHFTGFRKELCKGIFIKRSLFKGSSYYFFLTFGICGILGFVSWILNNSLVGSHPQLQLTLMEVHDKISFVLIFVFALHLKKGMGWMLKRTKEILAPVARP